MKALRFLTLLVGLTIINKVALFAQIDTSRDDYLIFTRESPPEYPGGQEVMLNFIRNKISYTHEARNKKINGKVYIEVFVNEDGCLSDIKVVKGLGYGLDSIAINIIRQMPKWIPGKVDGKVKRVKCVIPFQFAIRKKCTYNRYKHCY